MPVGRSLTFRIAPETDVLGALRRLRDGVSVDLALLGV
jgi:hypothetical protein